MRIVIDGHSYGPSSIERCMTEMSLYSAKRITLTRFPLGGWEARAEQNIVGEEATGPFRALCSLVDAMKDYHITTREGR